MNLLLANGASKAHKPRLKRRLFSVLPLLSLFIFIVIGDARLIGSSTSASASAASLVSLPGHVPGLVKTSTQLGSADANQSISLVVGLRLRNAQSLKNYVDSQSHAKSITAQHHMTP